MNVRQKFTGFPVVTSWVVLLAIWQHKSLKNVLISVDGDAEDISLGILMYLQRASTYIYNGYPKL